MFDRFTDKAIQGRREAAAPGIAVPNAGLTRRGGGIGRASIRLAQCLSHSDRHVGLPAYREPTRTHRVGREGRVH